MRDNINIGTIVKIDVPSYPRYGKVVATKVEDNIVAYHVKVTSTNSQYVWVYDGELEMVSKPIYTYYVIKGLLKTLFGKDKNND